MIQGGRTIDLLTPEELVCPGVVVNVQEKCRENSDYQLSIEDLLEWEAKFGKIPKGALVCMRTGWGAKFTDPTSYMNINTNEPHSYSPQGTMHFPGFSPLAATFLCKEREIAGIGIDTLSLDPGTSLDFQVHFIVLGSDKYQVENMMLENMPENGSTIVSLPIKVKGAPEMAARVIAFVYDR